jgi:predicted SAM-dependent methyltransferase
MKLHIGGKERHPDWKILDILPGPDVDFVGDCTDLSQFADGSIDAIYAAHVLEHLGYRDELPRALAECCRVLKPGGDFMISVPNFEELCAMFNAENLTVNERFHVMRVIFGGQQDAYDFHKMGFTTDFLQIFLGQAGFKKFQRVPEFGLFEDSSLLKIGSHWISLNVVATK